MLFLSGHFPAVHAETILSKPWKIWRSYINIFMNIGYITYTIHEYEGILNITPTKDKDTAYRQIPMPRYIRYYLCVIIQLSYYNTEMLHIQKFTYGIKGSQLIQKNRIKTERWSHGITLKSFLQTCHGHHKFANIYLLTKSNAIIVT